MQHSWIRFHDKTSRSRGNVNRQHCSNGILPDGDSIDRRVPHRVWRRKPNAERVHRCHVLAHLRRLLRPQLVMGFHVLDLSRQEEGPLSWSSLGHGSEFGPLLRPDAVLPDDAVAAEERHPCLLCHVDLVVIKLIRFCT